MFVDEQTFEKYLALVRLSDKYIEEHSSRYRQEYDPERYMVKVEEEIDWDRVEDYAGLDIVAYLFDTGNNQCLGDDLKFITRDARVLSTVWVDVPYETLMKLIPAPEKDFDTFRDSMYRTSEGQDVGGWSWYAVYGTGVYLRVHESINLQFLEYDEDFRVENGIECVLDILSDQETER